MAKGIKRYFGRFGEIESIYVPNTRQSSFCFVQYKSFDAAKVVLSKSSHRVAKRIVTVKPAYAKHQPDYKAFKPPERDSPKHILNALNDDCLRVIFKQFNLVDLSVAADVCVRFQLHATDAFRLKYKHTVNIEAGSEFKHRPDKFEVCLRNFGSLIHSLTVDNNMLQIDGMKILKALNEHAPALNDLKLYGFDVSDKVECVHPLFAKLQTLSLLYCTFTSGAEGLLAPCAQLKHLHIDNGDWDNCCIDHTFPQLEEIELKNCSTIDDDEFKRFITSNPTVKKLSLHDNSELTAAVIHSIGGLKDLVELQMDQSNFGHTKKFLVGMMGLNRLQSLQRLALSTNEFSVTPLLTKMAEKAVPLEHLSLEQGTIDSKGIQRMTELLKLSVIELKNIENFTDEHFISLAKQLPQLRKVHLTGNTAEEITNTGLRTMLEHAKTLSHLMVKRASNIQIDESDYRFILKTVQNRTKKSKLTIKLTGSGNNVKVSDELMSANRNWLWIEEKIDDDEDDDNDDIMEVALLAFNLFMNLRELRQDDFDDSDESDEDEADDSDMSFE